MDFSTLQAFECSLEDGLFHIVLNRPEQGNALGVLFCTEIHEIVNHIAGRPEIRAVLITARGRFFSVGGDIALMSADDADLPHIVKSLTSPLHVAIARLMQMNAPVVCAVHSGGTYGGAIAFAAAADVVVSSASAKFGAAFTGIGFSCDSGTSVALTQRLGAARARRFLLLNETLSAEEALAAGLVDKIAADDAVLAEATAIARKLASGPTLAYGEVKRLFLYASTRSATAQMEEEAQALNRVAYTADAREGLKSFREKRKPKFSGQ